MVAEVPGRASDSNSDTTGRRSDDYKREFPPSGKLSQFGPGLSNFPDVGMAIKLNDVFWLRCLLVRLSMLFVTPG